MNLAGGTETPWSETVMAIVFGFGFLIIVTVLMVAGLRAFVEFRKAKLASGREDQLRDLASRFEQLAASAVSSQDRTTAELAELRARVASIEELLRSVDD